MCQQEIFLKVLGERVLMYRFTKLLNVALTMGGAENIHAYRIHWTRSEKSL